MILFVCKKNSDNFIRHYVRYAEEFAPGSKLLIVDSRQLGEQASIEYVRREAESGHYEHIVFEWANDLTGLCLQYPFKAQVIVRLHDHEIKLNQDGSRRIDRINFSNVDRVWCINPQIRDDFRKITGNGVDTFFLPNAVDPEPFTENLADTKKIAMLSIYARKRKRIDRAIELMKLLPDWTLHIRCKGDAPDEDEGTNHFQQLRQLSGNMQNVVWEFRDDDFTLNGYPHEDVNQFFQDKAVVLSTSDREGFGYSIAEGALCGCMPVVYNWEYGKANEFWSVFVHDSIAEMADEIRTYEPLTWYRRYAEQMFSPRELWPSLLNIMQKRAQWQK